MCAHGLIGIDTEYRSTGVTRDDGVVERNGHVMTRVRQKTKELCKPPAPDARSGAGRPRGVEVAGVELNVLSSPPEGWLSRDLRDEGGEPS